MLLLLAFILAALNLPIRSLAQDFTCSPTKPCKIGCCGKSNVCGLGPTFCAPANCTSSCDQKSECDPGWGPQWSSREKCPLNVCCSKFGFCGTTSEFCGDTKVQSPSCSGTSSNQRTIGYYEAWSNTRPCDAMYPEQLPAGAYTHLNFAFAFVDPVSFAVAPMSNSDKDLYPRFTGLKATNPGLQTWISIGGWSMNDPDQPTHATFSQLAGSTDAQNKFFNSLISFMATYQFDGVDIDWEYPVAPERSGSDADFDNYVTFLSNLKSALGGSGHNYGLSITIPSSYWYMQHFDLSRIANIIDWFNVMTYDLHGTWDSTDPFIGSFVNAHTNLTEIDMTMDLLWRNNIDPAKVTLGLGFYGRSFTLSSPSCTTPGVCQFSSGGNPGECTQSSGTLSFAEIQRIVDKGASVTLDQAAAVKIVTFGGNQWVSYDDKDTLKMKIDYANKKCLGGTMVWAASTDTLTGDAAAALSASTGRLAHNLQLTTSGPQSIAQCFWGDCGADCPAGTTPAQRSDGKNKGNVGLWNGCAGHNKQRNYCCPPQNAPTCQWRGTAPFCDGKCHSGEVQVTTDNAGTGKSCATGHKALCCTSTASDSAIALCQWTGKAPSCAPKGKAADCPSGLTRLTQDSYGPGGDAACYTGAKSFCCPTPPPFQNCDWYSHGDKIVGAVPGICGTPQDCPSGKSPVASDPSGCYFGTASYFCCDTPGGSPELAHFQDLLDGFKADPTCSKGQRTVSKRDATGPLTSDQLALLTLVAAQLFQTQTQSLLQQQERAAFNTTLGPILNAHVSDFQQLYLSMPGMDPRWIAEEFMCLGTHAGDAMNAFRQTSSTLCVTPQTVHPGAPNPDYTPPKSLPPKDELRRRNMENDINDASTPFQGDRPSLGFLVEELLAGHFTYMYTRAFRLNEPGQGEIEVAFLMTSDPNNPNTINPAYQGDIPRPQDAYFVIHMHVAHIMDDINGVPRIGIWNMNAFHGQRLVTGVNQLGALGTVSNNAQGTRNERSNIFQCEEEEDPFTYWYVGTEPHPNVPPFVARVQQLGTMMIQNNWVNPQILQNYFAQPQNGIYTYIDWTRAPTGALSGPMVFQNGQWVPWQFNPNFP